MNSQPENLQYDAPHHGADPHAPGEGPDMDEPSGPPYRAIAMVLLAAVVLAVGVGLVQLFGSDDDDTGVTADQESSETQQGDQNGQPAGGEGTAGQNGQPGQNGEGVPGQNGQPGAPEGQVPGAEGSDPAAGESGQPGAGETGDADAAGQQGTGGPVPDVSTVPVQIYNNSTVTGLAGRTGEALRETGFAVGEVANMPSNRGVVSESTAFYGTAPGERAAAEAVADQLGIAVAPRPADMAGDAPGVIVVVTQDLAG